MDAANGVVVRGVRTLMSVVAVLVCAAAVLASLAPRTALADESAGYVTVSGVVGLDEGVVFSTITEAIDAIATCDAPAQAADPAGAVLVIHGTVAVDAQAAPDSSFHLYYPVDGSTYAIVGADGGACLSLVDSSGAGRASVFANDGGSLLVRGVTVTGPLGLVCRDNLGIDGSSFDAPVSCAAGGSIAASGNVFASSWSSPSASLYAELRGASGSLAFAGNRVSGYAAGLSVNALQGGAGVGLSVTSNTFSLDPAAAGYGTGSSYVVSLAGGPWVPSSVACDGNAVEGSLAFFVLDGSCAVGTWDGDGLRVGNVADGTLSADAVIALFELAGLGAAGAGESFAAVTVTPSYLGTEVAAQVDAASNALAPSAPVAVAEEELPVPVTVAYDGNGATAGEAPETVLVDEGQPVTVAHMGSLICAGCLFSGWNTAPDGSGIFYAAGQVIWPDGNTVLYAQWVPNGTVGTVAVVDQFEDRAV